MAVHSKFVRLVCSVVSFRAHVRTAKLETMEINKQIQEALDELQKQKFMRGFFWGFLTACGLITLICAIIWQ